MYEVWIINNGVETLIHSSVPTWDKPHLSSGVIKQGSDTKIESFTFRAAIGNPAHGAVDARRTFVKVLDADSKEVYFYGLATIVTPQMGDDGVFAVEVTCEGAKTFFCDSVVPRPSAQTEPKSRAASELLSELLANHNAMMPDSKKIYAGSLEINSPATIEPDYSSTWEMIKSVVSQAGGEIDVVLKSDGKLYLDHVSALGHHSVTAIELKKNMKSLSVEAQRSSIVTRVYPLGAADEETGEPLTISEINGGLPYIDDTDAQRLYGVVCGVVRYDEVHNVSSLKKHGEGYLRAQRVVDSVEVDAVDLYPIGLTPEDIRRFCWYHVINSVMGFDETMRVIEREIDILQPYASKITLGAHRRRLSELQSNRGKDGAPGRDAYTVLLTNENHTFVGTATGAVPVDLVNRVIAYKGQTRVRTEIAEIKEIPDGMTIEVFTPDEDAEDIDTLLYISVTEKMTQKSGIITIPVIFKDIAFPLTFSFTLATSGTSYRLLLSSQIISVDHDGTLRPNEITLTAQALSGSYNPAPYNGRLVAEFIDKNGAAYTYRSSTDESSHTLGISPGTKTIKCALYAAGGTDILLDQQSAAVVENGRNGIGTDSITEYYLASDKDSGIYWTTTGWTTTVQKTSSSKPYLWNYEYVLMSDGTFWRTDPAIIGTQGADGRSVSEVTEYYLASSSYSGISIYSAGWTTTIQKTSVEKPYLWNYEVTNFSDGSTSSTIPVIIGTQGASGANGTNGKDGRDGADGKDGAPGKDGVGTASVTEYYLASSSSSGVTIYTYGWTTSVQSTTSTKKYLWNYEYVLMSDGSHYSTDPVIIGTQGADGRGISSVTEHYLASSSSSGVTTSTSGWTTSMQSTSTSKPYLWNYETTNYTDGTTSNTTPVIIGTHGAKGDTGAQGGKGDSGEAAVSYSIILSDTVLKYDYSGASLSPSSITASFYKTVGAGSPTAFSGYCTAVQTFEGGSTTTLTGSGTSKTFTISTSSGGKKLSKVTLSLYKSSSSAQLLAQATAVAVMDGEKLKQMWCAENNETLIEGAKIYTGSIAAGSISADCISAGTLYGVNLSGRSLKIQSHLEISGRPTYETTMTMGRGIFSIELYEGGVRSSKLEMTYGKFDFSNTAIFTDSDITAAEITCGGVKVPQVQSGRVKISPDTSNVPKYVSITFSKAFSGVPAVVATAETIVPGTTVTGVGVSNITSTGCRIYLTRTNLTETTVDWIAVYGGE